MNKVIRKLLMGALAVRLVSPTHTVAQQRNQDGDDGVGTVFVMTNSVDGNTVITFKRAADGMLREEDRFATGGRGSGGITGPWSLKDL
jgi:6-phosphogluconolactonase